MTGPHVLYVAWGFPPARSGGVYRALATANAFAQGGAQVTVLTAEREAFERYTAVDPALEEHVDPRIEVRRLPFEWPAREPDRSRWPLARRALPRVWWHVRKRLDRIPFPESGYGPWRATLESAAREVHAQRPVDLVVATVNPYVDLAAPRVLAREHGVPYVVDHRDAWQLDVFSGRRTHRRGSRVDRTEKALLRGALEVWFVNEPLRAWHAAHHPGAAGRMHVVANGVDAAFAPGPRLDPPAADAPLRFGYLGTMSRQVPVEAFRRGWVLARSRSPELAGATAHVYGWAGHYAAPDPDTPVLTGEDGVVLRGPVSRTAVAQVYEQLDVVLLILGTGRYVTSGKVYEYMASALPVVSVHDPGNAAADVLRGYPLWFPAADLSAEGVAAALQAAAHAARTTDRATREAAARYGSAFAREAQLRPRVQALLAAASTATGRAPGAGSAGGSLSGDR
ncbi:glycosyltransferase [Ornithinimicrobium sp. W1665]|uniref:glycosyltransferase n=1 Tax=Ornithinimicrobium sp. W1665 TaxID=3416666 RepID=UPI003CF3AFE9